MTSYRGFGAALCGAIMALALAPTATAQQGAAPADSRPVLVKQELNQLSSPFTKPTVLMLNAITARSKVTIDAYDKAIPGIRAAVAARNGGAAARGRRQAAMARLNALAAQAAQERIDMKRAERRVRTSGEKYNDTILTAMVDFVVNVDTEIHGERATLAKKVAAR